MTNREYLSTLPNDKFTDLVLAKQAELHKDNNDHKLDIFDMTDGMRCDFEKWLSEEHKKTKKSTLMELKLGTKFKYAGHEFTKLADEECSCFCLLNDTVFESEFGETNDWAKSLIRERLNEFDDDGSSKVLPNINKDDLVAVSLNYYAYKIPNGRTEDRLTLLSWEEYFAYQFEEVDKDNWLRSGGYGLANFAHCLAAAGGSTGTYTSSALAVRPALHLKKDIEVEV